MGREWNKPLFLSSFPRVGLALLTVFPLPYSLRSGAVPGAHGHPRLDSPASTSGYFLLRGKKC